MARTFMPFRNGSMAPLEDLYREVDSLVQNIFDPEDRTSKFTPFANLAETETGYELTLDLPGVDPEDVSVELNEGRLVIAGERKSESRIRKRRFIEWNAGMVISAASSRFQRLSMKMALWPNIETVC